MFETFMKLCSLLMVSVIRRSQKVRAKLQLALDPDSTTRAEVPSILNLGGLFPYVWSWAVVKHNDMTASI